MSLRKCREFIRTSLISTQFLKLVWFDNTKNKTTFLTYALHGNMVLYRTIHTQKSSPFNLN